VRGRRFACSVFIRWSSSASATKVIDSDFVAKRSFIQTEDINN
jgi:hypothetical protein